MIKVTWVVMVVNMMVNQCGRAGAHYNGPAPAKSVHLICP